MTNYGLVLGSWGADQRNFTDGVGARSQMLRLGWEPPFGGYLQLRARTLANESYYGGDSRQYTPGQPLPFPYSHYYDVTLSYSHPWNGVTLGGEATAGRDVDGSSFTRLDAFIRYGGDTRTREDDTAEEEDDSGQGGPRHAAEWFVDAGVNANRVNTDLDGALPVTTSSLGFGPHFGLGARRAVSANNDLGVRLEIDGIEGHSLVGVRALDWRYRFGDVFAMSAFAGADRYDLATPAYSIYYGAGLEWRNFLGALPGWSLGFDFRHGQNIARDHVLPTDPQGPRPDSFYKIDSGVLYLSRHF
jgi:hypothetical protein